jgi:CubicO group peptidase (beta-lactamase class C family)
VPRGIPRSATLDNGGDDYLGIGSYGGGFNQKAYGGGTYGYAWWFNGQVDDGGCLNWPDAPADAFAAIGYGGNIMVMMPSKRLVVAARGNWARSRPQVNSLNDNLKLLADASH